MFLMGFLRLVILYLPVYSFQYTGIIAKHKLSNKLIYTTIYC